jgi:transposase
LAARRGKKKAAVAVGHSILIIAYHLLKDCRNYCDLGPNYFDLRDRERTAKRLVQRLEDLGYRVTAEPIAAA